MMKDFQLKEKIEGIGLNIAKDTIEDYPNVLLNTEIEDNLFKQELIIYNR